MKIKWLVKLASGKTYSFTAGRRAMVVGPDFIIFKKGVKWQRPAGLVLPAGSLPIGGLPKFYNNFLL